MKEVSINPSMIYLAIGNLGHKLETAIADLVDNSIQFKASYFKFGYYFDDLNKDNSFLYFYDNGQGMDEEELKNAMSIGSLQDPSKITLHSKFGLGLKISSLNNCDSFQVFTKKKGNQNISMKMFYTDDKKKLMVSRKTNLPKQLNDIFSDFDDQKEGTLIIWNKLKKNKFKMNSHSSFFSSASMVQSHLMLTFHRYIEEKQFSIFYNDRKLGFLNPTMPSLNTYKAEVTKINIEENSVEIIPYIVPSEDSYELSNEDFKITRAFLNSNNMDGLFLYRNNRLIDFGKWFDIISDSFRSSREPKKIKRIRIIINFNEKLDKFFSIEPTKSEIEIPSELRSTLFNLFDKMFRKVSSQNNHQKKKKDIITTNPNLWKVSNGKPSLNFDSEEIQNIIKDEKIYKVLKDIDKSIPVIVSHNIDFSDVRNKQVTLLESAIEAIELLLAEEDYDIKDCIELVCFRRPFKYDENLNLELRNHYNV